MHTHNVSKTSQLKTMEKNHRLAKKKRDGKNH